MPWVRLKRSWQTNFRRTLHVVRDKKRVPLLDENDQPITIEFTPGEPVEVSVDELEALRPDIGPALELMDDPAVRREMRVRGIPLDDEEDGEADELLDSDETDDAGESEPRKKKPKRRKKGRRGDDAGEPLDAEAGDADAELDPSEDQLEDRDVDQR